MMVFRPWWKVLKQNVTIYTFDHNFCLIVPCPSGFEWGQQTEGVMCHQVAIEGILVPLPMPNDILSKIQDAHYNYKPRAITKYWKKLKEWLKEHDAFEFEVNAPQGMPENQEGLQWIKITRWESSIDTKRLLIGEVVALYYPNCD